jgi:hypothetical protein
MPNVVQGSDQYGHILPTWIFVCVTIVRTFRVSEFRGRDNERPVGIKGHRWTVPACGG